MAPSPPPDDSGALRRAMNMQISVGSGTLPLAAIFGIAIGAALIFLVIFVSIAITCVRKHCVETKRTPEAKENSLEEMDLKTAIRSIQPPEISLSRRWSLNPFLVDDGTSSHDWTSDDTPMAKARRHKNLFRMTGARDSWPLLSNIPLALLPGQSQMTSCSVAPPGYVVEDHKWPKRSSSKLSRRRDLIYRGEERPDHSSTDPYVPAKTAQSNIYRESASENQLSAILISTSQRLKAAAHRRSLTHMISVLGQHPGSPPSERLPPPPGKQMTESREALVNKRFAESVAGSIYDAQRTRSLTTEEERLGKSFQPIPSRANSSVPSGDSRESLCGTKTPELITPESLTSPSKHGLCGERRHKIQLSLGSARDISMLIRSDSMASLEAIGGKDPFETKNIYTLTQQISVASDSFHSVKKSSTPYARIQGPGPHPPLYICKNIFGQEAVAEHPERFSSSLKDVPGKAQFFSRNSQSESKLRIPAFRWSPQEVMQINATQTSPTDEWPGCRRKGHKRSDVIRMSIQPQPPSTVDVVEREPDEYSPLRFDNAQHAAIRPLEPTKNSSRSTSSTTSRTLSTQQPSSAIFNPSLRIPDSATRSQINSPTLVLEDIRNGTSYSPTSSACNYYVECGGGSESESLSGRLPKEQVAKQVINPRRHSRHCSANLSLFPRHQCQQEQGESLVSFPPPSLSAHILTPPSSRPLTSIEFSTNGVRVKSSANAAPPVLTILIPSHLTDPRSKPSELNRSDQAAPLTVETSLVRLRQMNSEVLHCGSSSPTNDNSPGLTDHYSASISRSEEFEERGNTIGGGPYLSAGNMVPEQDQSRQRVVGKRDSHRIYKERRERRIEKVKRDEDGDRELTPVKEVSSPAKGANALGITNLRFATKSHEGTNGRTPPWDGDRGTMRGGEATPSKGQASTPNINESPRWSDEMSTQAHCATRRESKWEHPSPQTPPNWSLGFGPLGLASKGWMGDGANMENEEKDERPDSLGLYDQDGFLRSTPDREAMKLEKEMEGERRDSEWLSALFCARYF